MRATAIILLIASFSVGCARVYLTKPNTTAEQYAQDDQKCVKQATKEGTAPLDRHVWRGCMQASGYARERHATQPPASWRGR
jgi:hypothetical protein